MYLLSIIYKEIKKRMIYKIDYETKEGNWERVFDIEFSLTYSESNRTNKEWYSEIDVAPCVDGLIWLARDLDSSKNRRICPRQRSYFRTSCRTL